MLWDGINDNEDENEGGKKKGESKLGCDEKNGLLLECVRECL